MNAKERFYSGLAKETIGKITSNTDNWTSFLRTMSRNYEFTYPEQVMIYAQRPNATFCKPYEDWNAENYRRYVKRGSTGIALFVISCIIPPRIPVITSIEKTMPALISLQIFLAERLFSFISFRLLSIDNPYRKGCFHGLTAMIFMMKQATLFM